MFLYSRPRTVITEAEERSLREHLEGVISFEEVVQRHSTGREHTGRLRTRKNRMLKSFVGELI